MRKILAISLICVIFSCKPQDKKQTEIEKIKHYKMERNERYNELVTKDFETFDIKRFDQNKNENEDYVYTLPNGSRVREFGYKERGYFSQIFPKKSVFTISKGFYPNSNIKDKGPSFKDNCEIGIWYEFDEKGKLIKEIDLDKPFKIAINDIIEFLKKNEADLFSNFTSIKRSYDEKTKQATWSLVYRGKYKDNSGMFVIDIDDSSAEVVKVIKILGKEGEKEIIFYQK
ncbi:hypothetical protein [Flavobacterium humidisoli]|uniref:MORN repeat variant n=1 Tax=Flavobacterium humidisoli TaxID=2937442 RepID=A0ABY4LL84_9FLAO|nr:hypothetical protein [Flavobacterium humidisoli]UPZ13854.1 hypothetical protein M0M44_13950 [Flavobacterium humidisoli]